ncbi:MAG: alpha/beta fold hydrolase [Acidimicrobiales bacterium]|nr:alpha/beta fold hydrolase [Acidimicrobiales bacterium]
MTATESTTTGTANPGVSDRRRLLAGLPLSERRPTLGGVTTAVLEGGDGEPVVLLHGPGESGAKWLRIVPDLAATHRVIAPDLPAHGSSAVPAEPLSEDGIDAWLDELITATCATPPTLVGHVLGGAIAARYAARHGDRLRSLVLVDTLGLARFRPSPRFALGMARFLSRPSPRSYERFMHQCSYDLDDLRTGLGAQWEPFESYNVSAAAGPGSKAVGQMLRRFGMRPIPSDTLERITVPTTLVWGRHDRATRVRVAHAAGDRYGWPVIVIEDCADDPARDRPAEFLAALRSILP